MGGYQSLLFSGRFVWHMSAFGLLSNEGVQFGFAVAGVAVLATLYEYAARWRRGAKEQRDQYADMATVFIFLLLVAAGYIHQPFGGKDEPSIMITAGAGMQLFAFVLLWLAPRSQGESKKPRAPAEFGLLMVCALLARVWCTMKYEGYLPSDQTGDGCIQTLEFLSMQVTVVGLARQEIGLAACRRGLAALAAAVLCGQVCYGSLDSRPWVDRTFAATQYAEVAAWLYMADHARRGKSSATFVLPSLVQAACRLYFWICAYPELGIQPGEVQVRLQPLFPYVLVAVQASLAALIGGIGAMQDLRVPGLPTSCAGMSPDV